MEKIFYSTFLSALEEALLQGLSITSNFEQEKSWEVEGWDGLEVKYAKVAYLLDNFTVLITEHPHPHGNPDQQNPV